MARLKIALADLFVSCPYRSSLLDLRRDPISRRIFSRAIFRGVPMEPPRLPFLLCVVALQSLCTGRNRHARAASANRAIDRERAKIYPRLHYRAFRVELGLCFDRESEPLSWMLDARCSTFDMAFASLSG